MKKIISWRLEGDNIIMSAVSDDGTPDVEVELPNEIYKEIIVEGPPSDEQRIREIIDKIHEIINKRVLMYDKVIEHELGNRGRIDKGLKGLEDAKDKLGIARWKAYLDGVGKDKGILQEFRHLIKALYQEESKLRASLLRKMKSS